MLHFSACTRANLCFLPWMAVETLTRSGLAKSAAFVVSLWSFEAEARPTGEPQACANCHYEKLGPTIDVTMSNRDPKLGETINLKVSLSANAPGALRTGLMVSTDSSGEFSVVEADYMRLNTPTQILHSQPKNLVDGKADFKLAWKAPASPGVAKFTVWSITGNSNGTDADDHHATTSFQLAFGCAAKNFYPDADKDGYGNLNRPTLACTQPANLIAEGGDCDDQNTMVSPASTEICNVADDNCDGAIDENLGCGLVYLDADGDGYGSPSSALSYGPSGSGFSLNNKDCNDMDPGVFPGAREQLNGRDDDCNGQLDDVAVGGVPDPVPTTAPSMAPTTAPIVRDRTPVGSTNCAVEWRRNSGDSSWMFGLLAAAALARRRGYGPASGHG